MKPMVKRCFSSLKTIHPWMMILFLAGGYSIFTLVQQDWDPMAFVVIGKQFDPAQGITEMGYDGQFAYQIAKDPANAAPFLDEPAYRYQRILYPILAHLLAIGNEDLIPCMLILINLISLVLGTLATEKLLQDHGHSRWYAIAYGAFAGLLLSLRLNLTEPLAFALVQWGVLFFDRGRLWRSLPFFALAALTRELTLFFAAACVITLWADKRYRSGVIWGLGAIIPFGLWQVFLRLWLGEWGVNSGGARASSFELIPFRGWWGYPHTDPKIFILLSIFILLVALIPAMIGLVVGLQALWKGKHGLGVWILLFNAMIFPFLPTSNVLNLPGLLRITIGLVVAFLNYGAIQPSQRALRYSQLWLVLLVFGDGLIAIY
jgi:hypothetical protein